jgi:hypothetical protein
MSKNKRKRYAAEFKAKVALEALKAAVYRNYGHLFGHLW